MFLFTLYHADGVMSEVLLVHPDDVDWFVTLDETHHEMSTVGNRGGSTTTTQFANPSFPRSGDRVSRMEPSVKLSWIKCSVNSSRNARKVQFELQG